MGKPRLDLVGQRFGKFTVQARAEPKGRRQRWSCLCDCGVIKLVRTDALKSGDIKSCGCAKKEGTTKHGLHGTVIYSRWQSMLNRCRNPNMPSYKHYGARGIKVCDRWLDVTKFYEDMGDPPTRAHQIDRIDNDGDYSPENCRWVTAQDNVNNKPSTELITHDGRTQSLAQWAREGNMSKGTFIGRIRAGMTVDEAFAMPVHQGKAMGGRYTRDKFGR